MIRCLVAWALISAPILAVHEALSGPGAAGLHGKDLCRCCAPRLCHGDVLAAAAEWAAAQPAGPAPVVTLPCPDGHP